MSKFRLPLKKEKSVERDTVHGEYKGKAKDERQTLIKYLLNLSFPSKKWIWSQCYIEDNHRNKQNQTQLNYWLDSLNNTPSQTCTYINSLTEEMCLLPDMKSLLLYTYCLVLNKKLHDTQKGKKKISVLRHKITEQTQTWPLCLKYPTEFKVTMINLLKIPMKMQTTCKNRWEISAERFFWEWIVLPSMHMSKL